MTAKGAIRGLVQVGFLLTMGTANAQDQLHQVQAIVVGSRSPRHAWQADSVLRAQQGVVVSRTDHNTRNLMLHVVPACVLDAAQINALLQPVGMSIRCWQRTPILPGAAFRHLHPRDDCAPSPSR